MEQSEHRFDFSNKKLLQNTTYNLLGYTVPLVFALIFIPALINILGKERFGILSLSWAIIGYFSFFDFGIGKSVTKVISERIGKNDSTQIPSIFWNSLLFIALISAIVVSAGLFFMPSIIKNYINISTENFNEALKTFYLILFSIPIVTTTTSVRGFLEAYQKFDVVNFYRVILGISTFVLPYIVALLIDSLFWIVFSLLFIRLLVWIFYINSSFKTNKALSSNFKLKLDFNILKPVFRISIWITIVNIVGPIILYSDRFLISSLLSLTAVTYYSTPYEMITKLLILPTAFVGVLFPTFSASFNNNPEQSRQLFVRSVKFIYLILFPVVLLISTFSYEILYLWLDEKFAVESHLVLKYLAIGILFSSLSSIPNNFFQGIGKPNIPAILNLIELPIYIILMYLFIKWYGIEGAALFWMIAAGIDAFINYFIAFLRFKVTLDNILITLILISLIVMLIFPSLSLIWIKIALSTFIVIIFIYSGWNLILNNNERAFLLENVSKFLSKK